MFGGEQESSEEEKKNAEAKNFDLLKYDGLKALRIHQVEYAEKCFREALKIHDDLETRDYLSQALMRQNRLDEALADYQVQLEQEKRDYDSYQSSKSNQPTNRFFFFRF